MATNKPKDPASGETAAEKHGARRTLIVVSIAVLVIFLAVLFWFAVWVLLVFFAGILLAIFLRGLATGLHQWTRLGMGGSLLIVVVVLAVLALLLGWLLTGRVSVQVIELSHRLPEAFAHLRKHLEQYAWGQQVLLLAGRINPVNLARPEFLGTAGGVLSTAWAGSSRWWSCCFWGFIWRSIRIRTSTAS